MTAIHDKSSAQVIRKKSILDRNDEEQKFVAIDKLLNAHLYCTADDTGWPSLSSARIQKILSLSPMLLEALGFLESSTELEVYQIIHRHYNVEGCRNRGGLKDIVKQIVTIETRTISVEELGRHLYLTKRDFPSINDAQLDFGAEDTDTGRLDLQSLCFITLEKLKNQCKSPKESLSYAKYQIFIEEQRLITLAESVSMKTKPETVNNCPFVISRNGTSKLLKSLKISLVFQGILEGNVYLPNRTSLSLKKVNRHGKEEEVNVVVSELQLNSQKQIGRVVIEYCAVDTVIEGHYVLSITSFSKGSCTVSFLGEVVYALDQYLVNELHSYVDISKQCKCLENRIEQNRLDTSVLERKKELAGDLQKQELKLGYETEEQLTKEEEEENEDRTSDHNKVKRFRLKYLYEKTTSHLQMANYLKVIEEGVLTQLDLLRENETDLAKNLSSLQKNNNERINLYEPIVTHLSPKWLVSLMKECLKCDDGRLQMGPHNNEVKSDLSFQNKSRSIEAELCRVKGLDQALIDSSTLHSVLQLYPKVGLLDELRRAKDDLILQKIHQEANELKSHLHMSRSNKCCDDSDSFDSFESEDELIDHEKESTEAKLQLENKICHACSSGQCNWSSNIPYLMNLRKRNEITKSILQLKQSQLYLSIKRGEGTHSTISSTSMINDQLLDLQLEAKRIDDQNKLYNVDIELHNAFNKLDEKYIVTRSLHNYDSVMETDKAILALGKEQDRLVGKVCANEVVFGILDWMDEGWCFSTPKEGKYKPRSHSNSVLKNKDLLLQNIHVKGLETYDKKEQIILEERKADSLKKMEIRMKFSMLYTVLQYLRYVDSLKKGKPVNKVKMEEEAAKRRNEKIKDANEMARAGARRIAERQLYEARVQAKRSQKVKRETSIFNTSALTIQKHFRGMIGRKVADSWKKEISFQKTYRALCTACATTIARCVRGHFAREYVRRLKQDMVEFMMNLRLEDLRKGEEEMKHQEERKLSAARIFKR